MLTSKEERIDGYKAQHPVMLTVDQSRMWTVLYDCCAASTTSLLQEAQARCDGNEQHPEPQYSVDFLGVEVDL